MRILIKIKRVDKRIWSMKSSDGNNEDANLIESRLTEGNGR